VAYFAAVSMGVGIGMSRLAMRTGQLKLRRAERRCPACGRLTERRVCTWCISGG
jgi:recombinational DNA repair protein RecR